MINAGEKTLAFELIFGFTGFLPDKLALDLLRSTINLFENPEDSESVFLKVLEQIFESNRTNLAIDAIYFTVEGGFIKIAQDSAKRLLALAKGEEKNETLAMLEPLKKELKL